MMITTINYLTTRKQNIAYLHVHQAILEPTVDMHTVNMCPNEVFLYAVFSQSNWGGAGQIAPCRKSKARVAYMKGCPGQFFQKKSRIKIMNKRTGMYQG